MIAVLVGYKNTDVTNYYIETIGEALKRLGYDVEGIISSNEIEQYPRKALYVVINLSTALNLLLKRRTNYIYWVQGVEAEESFVRNHSNIRLKIMKLMETFFIKQAKFVVFVSKELQKHYEQQCKMSFDTKAYCMPCFNTSINIGTFTDIDQKEVTFCYIGSLDPWQQFPETVSLFYEMSQKSKYNMKLLVLTRDQKKAEKILKNYPKLSYELDFVPNEKLNERLKDVHFGFVIRNDDIINRVATPTKLSTYIANGVIPIYSTSLKDFHEKYQNEKYVVAADNGWEQKVNEIISSYDLSEIKRCYTQIFEDYYGREKHIVNLCSKIGKSMATKGKKEGKI